MKDYKKAILGILKKRKDSGDKFESQVLKLTLKQMDGARDDGWGVFYSKNGKSLVSAKKSIEGSYAVKDDTEEIGDNAFWGCAFLRKGLCPTLWCALAMKHSPAAFRSSRSASPLLWRR